VTRIPRTQRYHLGTPAPVTRTSVSPLRVLAIGTAPLWIWLAICLLAVGGWVIPLAYLLGATMVRPRRGRSRRRTPRGSRRG
jgi:fatty acid desaturase